MFRFPKSRDIITLFHKASSPGSVRVVNLIKQASANASETTTSDQTSGNAAQTKVQREEFELNVTEEPPTADQLRTILEYVGPARIPSIVKGANTEMEALKLFKESADNFQRPVVVDWHRGKAVGGDKESEILKMINELPQK